MSTTNASLVSWGGLLETIYGNCQDTKEVPKKIRILRRKITRLEESKTIEDIQYSLHFTKEERNYLNSPLLDEIFDTIFSKNPIETSIEKDKLLVFLFYSERTLINYEEIIQDISTFAAVKILRYLVENKKIKIDIEKCFRNCHWESAECGTDNNADIFMMFCLEKLENISDDMIGIVSNFYEESFEKMLDKINPINAEKMLYNFCLGEIHENKIKKLLQKLPII